MYINVIEQLVSARERTKHPKSSSIKFDYVKYFINHLEFLRKLEIEHNVHLMNIHINCTKYIIGGFHSLFILFIHSQIMHNV